MTNITGLSQILVLASPLIFTSCKKDFANDGWKRYENNPVFRDEVDGIDYEIASDAHVFYDQQNNLQMIYTGDVNDKQAIKLASGDSWTSWSKNKVLLDAPNSEGTDVHKETGFYRLSSTGVHQIFYIGYANEASYEAQIFLAESASLTGTYTQYAQPVVPKGMIADKNVYCMTSPSIVEHDSVLYMVFIGWNDAPERVTEVWIMGATSTDDGHTWSNFQLVETPIGMEGQITKAPDGTYVAVRTGEYTKKKEAIYYSTASHPFGPWTENAEPILIPDNGKYEKNELIASQITYDINTGKPYLFYTGANHKKGWWIMMACKE